MSAKHLPSVTWLLRPLGKHPNGSVQTVDTSKLYIEIEPFQADGIGFCLPRRDARLLARRILQCLEDTAS